MIERVLLAGLLVVASPNALAERPPQYSGASLGQFELDDAEGNVTDTVNSGRQAGYTLTAYVAVELHGGFESGDASGALD